MNVIQQINSDSSVKNKISLIKINYLLAILCFPK